MLIMSNILRIIMKENLQYNVTLPEAVHMYVDIEFYKDKMLRFYSK
jgi:hypothetical protein